MNNFLKISIPALFALILLGCIVQKTIAQPDETNFEIGKSLSSKGIIENVDSLVNREFDSLQSKLQTSKDQKQIEALLAGIWIGKIWTRVNGKDVHSITEKKFIFMKNFHFMEINNNDTILGEFVVDLEAEANLQLIYDEPQLPPYPEEMMRNMSEEELQQAAYSERVVNIFEIEKDTLVFYNVLPLVDYLNPQIITHSRLILEVYKRE